MIIGGKVTVFFIADDLYKVFDAQIRVYTIKSNFKRRCHRESTMSKAKIPPKGTDVARRCYPCFLRDFFSEHSEPTS